MKILIAFAGFLAVSLIVAIPPALVFGGMYLAYTGHLGWGFVCASAGLFLLWLIKPLSIIRDMTKNK